MIAVVVRIHTSCECARAHEVHDIITIGRKKRHSLAAETHVRRSMWLQGEEERKKKRTELLFYNKTVDFNLQKVK